MRNLSIVMPALFLVLGARAWAVADLKADPPPPMPPTVAEGAKLAVVYEEAKKFFEGPAWNPKEQKLYFTSFGGKTSLKVMRLEEPGKAIVWLDHTEGVNGTWLGQDGRLIGAQAYGHRVMSYDLGGDGPKDPKALYENVELHQPNDVCQTPNGDIYFSDPDFKGKTASAVYVLKPDGAVKKVLTDMAVTNGLIASLDGKTLYVGDSHKKHWRAYPILEDGTVGEGKLFFEPKTESKADPDGMSIDEKGNLYFTGMGGVWVVAPDGAALGFIPIPEFCSNVTFGGSDGKTLYCTCSGKVYSLAMNLRGGAFATHK